MQEVTLTAGAGEGVPFAPIHIKIPKPDDIDASEIHVMTESRPSSRRRSIPPEFSTELIDKIIEEGDSVEMQIYVTGTPPPEVVWYKDEQPITIYPHRRFHATKEDELCSLEIKDARCSDQGTYTCSAYNTAGKVQRSCKLSVTQVTPTSAPAFLKHLKDVHIVEGCSTRFDVKVTGMPEPDVVWYKDGQRLQQDNRVEIIHDDDTSALILKYGKLEDAGDYTCVAQNTAGNEKSLATLHIAPLQTPAKFTSLLKNLEVEEGDPVRLECMVIGRPDPKIAWYKDEEKVKESGRVKVEMGPDNTCMLKIVKSDLDDEGTYTCKASNSAGKDSTSAKLAVNGEGIPPVFSKALESAEIPDGSPVRLEVRVKGKPTPFIEWFKGPKQLKPGPRFETQASGNLHSFLISSCRDDDGGIYTCRASNKFGTATCEARLLIAEDTVPPRFTKKLYDSTADAGNTVEFSVKYIGTPEPKVSWFLDDEEISEDDEGMDIETEPGSSLLVLEDIAGNDSGQYKCIITNLAGRAVTNALLKVLEGEVKTTVAEVQRSVPPAQETEATGFPPTFVKELSDVHVTEGDAVKMEVITGGIPTPTVQWFVENQPVTEDGRVQIITEGNVHALVIDGTVLEDEAEYKCTARNPLGKVECLAELLVDKVPTKPRFLKELRPIETREHKDAVFEVQLEGHPEPEIAWFKDNVLIERDPRYEPLKDRDVHKMVVHDAVSTDTGEIKCQAQNDVGEVQSVALLVVKPGNEPEAAAEPSSAPVFLKKPQDAHVVEGDAFKFEVNVVGSPTPDIKWYNEEDEEIPKAGHLQCLPDGTLLIDKTTLEDEGLYKCIATNSFGQVSCSVELLVDEMPNAMDTSKITDDVDKVDKIISVVEDTLVESEVPVEGVLSAPKVPTNPPIFAKQLQDLCIKEGDSACFEVRVTGAPKPKVLWLTDGENILGNEETVLETDGDTYRLVLKNVVSDDEGEYSCSARNDAGEVECTAKLSVVRKIEKPSFLEVLKDIEVAENTDVRLEVRLQGTEPEVDWYKDGNLIEEASSHSEFVENQERGSYAYFIYGATRDDQGAYRCVALNNAGEVSCEGKLTVKENVIEPRFLQCLECREVPEGNDVDLEVEVSGKPKPSVKWFKDGNEIVSGRRIQIETEGRIHTLCISKSSVADEGEYTCVASNSGGEQSCSASLVVEKEMEEPSFLVQPAGAQIVEGGKARFEAVLSGVPEPEIEWFKDKKPIQNSHHFQLEFDGHRSVLTLVDAKLTDEGDYTCTAANKAGKVSCTVDLIVGEAVLSPEFVKKMNSIELCEGDIARFDIRVSGTPQPKVQWFKNEQPLEEDIRYEFLSDDDMHSLELANCLLSDSGTFRCTATNEAGEASCIGELAVKERPTPPTFTEEPSFPEILEEGGDVVLEATVAGKPPPTVEWVKDDANVKNSSHLKIQSKNGNHTLTVSGAGEEDSGVYKCIASNPAGTASKTFNVNIQGKSCLYSSLQFCSHLLHE